MKKNDIIFCLLLVILVIGAGMWNYQSGSIIEGVANPDTVKNITITLTNNEINKPTTLNGTMTITTALRGGNVINIPAPNMKMAPNTSLVVNFTNQLPSSAVLNYPDNPNAVLLVTLAANAQIAAGSVLSFGVSNMMNPRDPQAAKPITVSTSTSGTVTGAIIDSGNTNFPEIIVPANSPEAATRSTVVTDDIIRRQQALARSALSTYNDAKSKYDGIVGKTASNPVEISNAKKIMDDANDVWKKLIGTHPDSWFDGTGWHYGTDQQVNKCKEQTTRGTGCQNVYKRDASGNIIKDFSGNDILLMYKCPFTCSNTSNSSNACRYDSDCLKMTAYSVFLPDGTPFSENPRRDLSNAGAYPPAQPAGGKLQNGLYDMGYGDDGSEKQDTAYVTGVQRSANDEWDNRNKQGIIKRTVKGIADLTGDLVKATGKGVEYAGKGVEYAGGKIQGAGRFIDPYDEDPANPNSKAYLNGAPRPAGYRSGNKANNSAEYGNENEPGVVNYYTNNFYYGDAQQVKAMQLGELQKSQMAQRASSTLDNVKPFEPAFNP